MNIVFIGMRGVGKSKLSRRFSVLTKRPVLSTDTLISYENQGRSIADMIADHAGDWRAFREMEYRVIQKVARLDGIIVDAGGGVVVDLDHNGDEVFSERKISALRQNGTIVWLRGDIASLAAKVRQDSGRPTISAHQSEEEIMWRRLPFYEKSADTIVDMDGPRKKRSTRFLYDLLL